MQPCQVRALECHRLLTTWKASSPMEAWSNMNPQLTCKAWIIQNAHPRNASMLICRALRKSRKTCPSNLVPLKQKSHHRKLYLLQSPNPHIMEVWTKPSLRLWLWISKACLKGQSQTWARWTQAAISTNGLYSAVIRNHLRICQLWNPHLQPSRRRKERKWRETSRCLLLYRLTCPHHATKWNWGSTDSVIPH